MTVIRNACSLKFSPQSETGLGEHLTKSRPNSVPTWETSATMTRVSALIWTLMFTFMVMLALYTSALTNSARSYPGRWAVSTALKSWGEGQRTAGTMIPAPARGSLPPVKLSERGTR